MVGARLRQTLRLFLTRTGTGRADYLRKKQVFASIGENCVYMGRTVPLYAKLISLGNNVTLASNVTLATHDILHQVVNRAPELLDGGEPLTERLGCIEIGDNVFVGAGATILYNVRIGSDCVIAAGSVVTKDIPAGSVAAGVPARVIGTTKELIEKRRTEQASGVLGSLGERVDAAHAEAAWEAFRRQR